MELIVERPEASLPEKAWIDETRKTLEIDFHEYDKMVYYHVDIHKSIPLADIEFMVTVEGARGGFKKLGIRIKNEYWYISKNHKELTDQIFNLLKDKVNHRKDIE